MKAAWVVIILKSPSPTNRAYGVVLVFILAIYPRGTTNIFQENIIEMTG